MFCYFCILTTLVEADGIKWKSAMSTDDDTAAATVQKIPNAIIDHARWTVFGRSGHLRIGTNLNKGVDGDGDRSDDADSDNDDDDSKQPKEYRFDGFPHTDYERLKIALSNAYSLDLNRHDLCPDGSSFGNTDIDRATRNLVFRKCELEDADEEGEEFEPRDGSEIMSLPTAEISQCVLPGNNRNEIELQFHEVDAAEAGTDQLVAVRFYVPPDPDADPTDMDAATPAEAFQRRLATLASIKDSAGGDAIVKFDSPQGTFLTPRGRYSIELHKSFFRMRGSKYDYKIRYDDISRLFLLPKPDDVHMAFVIALDRPIRQGQQRYGMLVLQTTKDQAECEINLTEEVMEKDYGGDLQPVMRGHLCNLVAKTFKTIARKKVFVPGRFANAYQQACVKCALRANEGHLYPLERSLVFIHKPSVLVRFDEVESVEFQRYAAGGRGVTRNFDLCVNLKKIVGEKDQQEYVFSGIDRSDYAGLYGFLSGKKIPIKNIQAATGGKDGRDVLPLAQPVLDVGDDPDDDSESDDTDFKTDDSGDSSSEGDDDSEGAGDSNDDDSIDADGSDSDLEEARKRARKQQKGEQSKVNVKKVKEKVKEEKVKEKVKEEKKKRRNDDEDDSRKKKKMKETKSPKKIVKKKKPIKKKKATKKKKKKDPRAPKNPMSAYMQFSVANRAKVKEKNAEASFGDLSRLISTAYKALTEEGMEKYTKMAATDKERYTAEMEKYVPPPESSSSDSDSDSDSNSD